MKETKVEGQLSGPFPMLVLSNNTQHVLTAYTRMDNHGGVMNQETREKLIEIARLKTGCSFPQHKSDTTLVGCPNCLDTGVVPRYPGLRVKCPESYQLCWGGGRGWLPSEDLAVWLECVAPEIEAVNLAPNWDGEKAGWAIDWWASNISSIMLEAVDGESLKDLFIYAWHEAIGEKANVTG